VTDRDRVAARPPAPAPVGPGADQVSPAFLLMNVGRRLRTRAEAQLRREGLSLRHMSALGHLSREPGLSYSELARRAGITAQSMQATLTHLEDLGAVERLTEPGRGRSARLRVTELGDGLLGRARDVMHSLDGELLAELGGDRRQLLAQLLLQLFAAAPPPESRQDAPSSGISAGEPGGRDD
jgi:DNA-binding MarR family transcriptional regulator